MPCSMNTGPVGICYGLILNTLITNLAQLSVGQIIPKRSSYQYLSSDLKNMLTSYTNCHIHIFLATDDDVEIDNLEAPVYLTVPHGEYFENVTGITEAVLLDYISNTNILNAMAVGPCLANLFVVTNVKLTYGEEDFNYINLLMLKQRGNSLITPVVNLLLMHIRFLYTGWIIREKDMLTFHGFYWNLAGSGFTIGILYDLEQWGESTGTSEQWGSNRKAVLAVCNHCKRVHTLGGCPYGTGYNCYLVGMAKLNEWAASGNAIRWVVLRISPLFKQERHFFKVCQLPKSDCRRFRDWRDFTLYNFLTQSINSSLLATPLIGYLLAKERVRQLPRIGWTKDAMTGSLYTRPIYEIYTHRFPLEPDHHLRDNFKFITVDIVEKRSNSIIFYTQPLELPVWLLTIAAAIVLTIDITATVAHQLRSIRTFLKGWSTTTFWIAGILVDQADSCKVEPAANKGGRKAFATLLGVTFFMNLIVGNLYKCMFSTNVLVGSQYEPRVERLDGLKDYKLLFPVDEKLKKKATYNKYNRMNLSKHDEWINIHGECGFGFELASMSAVCSISELMAQYMMADTVGCDTEMATALKSKNPQETFSTSRFCPPEAKLVVKLWIRSEFVFTDEIVGRLLNLTEAEGQVAVVTTEEHLPVIWSELKGKMGSKRFAHTMLSPKDNSTRRREHMILVSSGMSEQYTNVVARHAHVLMSSGIWSHWTGRLRWKDAITRLQAYELGSDAYNRAPMVIFWTLATCSIALFISFGIEVLIGGKGFYYNLGCIFENVVAHAKATRRWIWGLRRGCERAMKKVRRSVYKSQ